MNTPVRCGALARVQNRQCVCTRLIGHDMPHTGYIVKGLEMVSVEWDDSERRPDVREWEGDVHET